MAEGPKLAQGTWEDAEALVGTVIATQEGADEVTAPDVRRKLEAIGWDCPLHTDPAVARAHGHPDVVAPASMARCFAMPAYWRPGQERPGTTPVKVPIAATSVPGIGDTLIATRIRMEYLAPVHPGDRLRSRSVLKSVTRKRTRVGDGASIVVETTYLNQRDESVTIETATLLRYQSQAA